MKRGEELAFVGWITAGHVVIHWFQQLFPVVTPTIKAALGLSDVEIGIVSTARTLSAGFLPLPVGMASDAYPRQRVLLLAGAIVVMGGAFTLVGGLPGFFWFVIASFLSGVGTALWHPAAQTALSLRFPLRRGTMLSIHGTGATIGDTLTPLAAGGLLALFAWQPFLMVQIVPALIFGAVFWRLLASPLAPIGQAHASGPSLSTRLRDMAALVQNRPFVVLTLASASWGIGRVVVLTFLPIYLQEDLGYSTVVLGFYIALLHILGIVSQTALGVLSDRFGRKNILVPSFGILGTLYIALAYAPPGIALGVVIAAIGIFFYTLANIVLAAIYDVVDVTVQASASGFQSVLSQLLVLPSPVIAGIIITTAGTAPVFVMSGVLAIGGALLMLVTDLRRPEVVAA